MPSRGIEAADGVIDEEKEDTVDERMMRSGIFSWNELMTTDIGGAKAFHARGRPFGTPPPWKELPGE